MKSKSPPAYLEFAVASNFSFLRGASHPEELMLQAAHLELDGIGLCDRNSVAGVVRAHLIKREQQLPLAYHPGARLVFADGTPDILAYPRDRPAWGRLCRLLSRGNLRAHKGECILYLDDLLELIDGLELIVMERSSWQLPARPLLRRSGCDTENAERTSRARFDKIDAQPCGSVTSPRLRGEVATRLCAAGEGGSPWPEQMESPPHPDPLPASGEREQARRAAWWRANFSGMHAKRGVRPVSRSAKAASASALLARLREAAPGRVRLAAAMLYRGNDRRRLAERAELARTAGVPLIAVNDVIYHHHERRELQDVLTCIREHLTIDKAGRRLAANAERYLKPPAEMARLFGDAPQAIEETLRLAAALAFSLDQLAYEYPDEVREGFATPQDALAYFTWEGAARRYPHAIPEHLRRTIEHELALIAELNYAPYFLTVHDIVRYARSKSILCQGRGSAANSAVCFCLGITEVDPERIDLLFERFISADRREPPDIDVDFEHERREEVIQYIYRRFGRDHAGIAGTVISYRGRSAIREVGKVFGLSEDTIGALSSSIWGMGGGGVREAELARAGIDLASRRMRKMRALALQIQSFPRHLSQHVGGFVITRSRLDEVVPIGNAAMDDRTFVEWDKDDLDALRILKVDVLGLGMLTCIRKGFELVEKHYGEKLTLATIPPEQATVYRMLCRADSLGVFQVESRAQMSMLPRLRPERFYDLVIEVAIVRPGPIQGDMVHPYLQRREKFRLTGEEPEYPAPATAHGDKNELKDVLSKTLGVPLFQEQAMKIAIVAARFTPSEADRLRRAMATFRRVGTIGTFQRKMVEGMVSRGYEREFAERCFSQIEGFGEYGFPESHAASFALLVYASAWLKCHYPDAFAAALINSQPMGFYAPAQIVRDVREHGVEVRPVDINRSDWDLTLEAGPCAAERLHELHRDMAGDIRSACAVRLGLRKIKGLSEELGRRIADKRGAGYSSVRDLWLRTGISPRIIERLAAADAFGSLGLSRRQALWAAKALGRVGDAEDDLPLFRAGIGKKEQVENRGEQNSDGVNLTHISATGFTSPRLRGEVGEPPESGEPGEGDFPHAVHYESPPHPPRAFTRVFDAPCARRPLPASGERPARHAHGVSTSNPSSLTREPHVELPRMPLGEEVVHDYRCLELSLRAHPACFLRADLASRGIICNAQLRTAPSGSRVSVSGLVTIRQQPGSAHGVIFMTIEDETAVANIIVWPKTFERFRPIILGARYIAVTGELQRQSGVIHVVAARLDDLTALLARLTEDAPPIESLARADAVKRPHDESIDSRARGRRNPPRIAAPSAYLPSSACGVGSGRGNTLASDLDVPARGSAHSPTRRGGTKVGKA